MAAACAVGLVGAFVKISASSLWSDELYTAYVVGTDHSLSNAVARMLTDVHPPLYYMSVALFANLLGPSIFSLRLLSAILGCLAVGLFLILPRRSFSLNARLFGGAVAVSSPFWFYQTQNARDYTLSMVIGVLLLHLSLVAIDQIRKNGSGSSSNYNWLCAVGIVGACAHFYDMFEYVGLVLILAAIDKGQRWRVLLTALPVVLVGFAYLKFFIEPNSKFLTTKGWIENTPSAYLGNTTYALNWVARATAWLAIFLCLVLAAGVQWFRWRGVRSADKLSVGSVVRNVDPVLLVCVGTPVLLWLIGFASSQVITPNFTYRNWLVSSPFFWGAFARVYDLALPRIRGWGREAAAAMIVLLLAYSGTTVLSRGRQYNQPFSEAAAMVRSERNCAHAKVPVIQFSLLGWKDAAFAEATTAFGYDYYLRGYATAMPVLYDDVQDGRQTDFAALSLSRMRDPAHQCPVVALAIHGWTEENVGRVVEVERRLAAANGIGVALAPVPITADVMLGSRRSKFVGGYAIMAQPQNLSVASDPAPGGTRGAP